VRSRLVIQAEGMTSPVWIAYYLPPLVDHNINTRIRLDLIVCWYGRRDYWHRYAV